MSYIDNVSGEVNIVKSVGSIQDMQTNGNTTIISATAKVKTTQATGKIGIAKINENNYNKLNNLPSINGIILKGNKTTEDLGIVGTSMTEIEVSTDQNNPTDISPYLEESGTYVAKNSGCILLPNDIATTIAKGGTFEIFNLRSSASALGIEVSDKYNIIRVSATVLNADIAEEVVLQKNGLEDWITEVNLTNENIYEYVELSGSSMTEIEVSTDPENPTDISQYFNESGTYVAKNTGIIEVLGEIVTLIAKGGFFTIQNFKHDAGRFGIAVPDEANTLIVSLTVYNGEVAEEVRLKRLGADDWYVGVKITSDNASDYLDLDIDVTSEVQQVLKNAVNNTYGMQLIGNYLSFVSATTNEIDSANTPYRVITPSNINYAIEKKGANYFASKTGFENLKTDISTLKAEIETILESVVKVDE